MKALAAKLFMTLLRMVGIRYLLKMAWSKALYPELKKYTDSSEAEWDNKVLDAINKHIYKIIDAF